MSYLLGTVTKDGAKHLLEDLPYPKDLIFILSPYKKLQMYIRIPKAALP